MAKMLKTTVFFSAPLRVSCKKIKKQCLMAFTATFKLIVKK